MTKTTIMYICDKHACKRRRGESLLCEETPRQCWYTSDPSHAANFDAGPDGTLWERMHHAIEEKKE